MPVPHTLCVCVGVCVCVYSTANNRLWWVSKRPPPPLVWLGAVSVWVGALGPGSVADNGRRTTRFTWRCSYFLSALTWATGDSLRRSRHTWTGRRWAQSCSTCRPEGEERGEKGGRKGGGRWEEGWFIIHTVGRTSSYCLMAVLWLRPLVLKVRPAGQWRPAETLLAARNDIQEIYFYLYFYYYININLNKNK